MLEQHLLLSYCKLLCLLCFLTYFSRMTLVIVLPTTLIPRKVVQEAQCNDGDDGNALVVSSSARSFDDAVSYCSDCQGFNTYTCGGRLADVSSIESEIIR